MPVHCRLLGHLLPPSSPAGLQVVGVGGQEASRQTEVDSSSSFQRRKGQEETSPLRGGEEEQEGSGKGQLKRHFHMAFNAEASEM